MTFKIGDWVQIPYYDGNDAVQTGSGRITAMYQHHFYPDDYQFFRLEWHEVARKDTMTGFPIWRKKTKGFNSLFPLELIQKKLLVTPIGQSNQEYLFNPNFNYFLN